jgi:hypothetical protein
MTETVIVTTLGMLVFIYLGFLFFGILHNIREIEVIKSRIACRADYVIEIGRLRDDIHKLRNFLTAQASEASKKVDWEPDDYKDLSDGTPDKIEKVFKENNFKDRAKSKQRPFDDDDLSEVSHMLQDHKLREYGG